MNQPRLNEWFDRLPRVTVDVGWRRLPLFRSIGVLGFQIAVAVNALMLVRVGLSMTLVVGTAASTAASFFAWGLLRRAMTGVESYVLLEHVWVASAALAGLAWMLELPWLRLLDACSVALAVFLAFGRVGCLRAGCCHGTPAPIGIRYPPATHGEVVRPRHLDRRLFPVQLVESVGLVAIALIGVGVAGCPPGTAFAWFLVSYGLLRFGTEALRGDARPHLGPISSARWMSAVQVAAALVGYEVWVAADPLTNPARIILIGAAGVAASAGVWLAVARAANPLTNDAHLDEAWEVMQYLVQRLSTPRNGPVVATTGRGLILVATAEPSRFHVSLSHPDHDVVPVAVALAPNGFVERNGVCHLYLERAAGIEPAAVVEAGGGIEPVADEVRPTTGSEVATLFAGDGFAEYIADREADAAPGTGGDAYFDRPARQHG